MTVSIDILGTSYIVYYGAKVTFGGAPESGPTYSSGGEPAEPMEFEVTLLALQEDIGGGKLGPELETPAWLKALIEEHLQDDERVYSAVEDMHHEPPDDDF